MGLRELNGDEGANRVSIIPRQWRLNRMHIKSAFKHRVTYSERQLFVWLTAAKQGPQTP